MYQINNNTLMLINENTGYYRTRIIETDNEIYSTKSVLQIIDSSCTDYGSSYEGRCQTVHQILNSKTTLPIPVHPKKGIYLVPTGSMRNENFTLISFFRVKEFSGIDNNTHITFENDFSYYLSITAKRFDRQMKRTSVVIAYFHRLIFLDYFNR